MVNISKKKNNKRKYSTKKTLDKQYSEEEKQIDLTHLFYQFGNMTNILRHTQRSYKKKMEKLFKFYKSTCFANKILSNVWLDSSNI